ncbi:MAG: type VII secretion protein EssC [Oscillospiraceae bacterium]|nr:type VII secretion protein EssC [Oscillospiraceae bacterium]
MRNRNILIVKNKNYCFEYTLENFLYLDKDYKLSKKDNKEVEFEIKNNKLFLVNQNNKDITPYKEYIVSDKISFIYFNNIENNTSYFKLYDNLVIGNDSFSNIKLNTDKNIQLSFNILNNNLTVLINSINIYHNGKLICQNIINYEYGDLFIINNIRINVYKNYLIIIGSTTNYNSSVEEYIYQDKLFDDFPFYNKSPRIVKRVPTENISILKPMVKPNREKGQLIKIIIPPIVMTSLTIVISIFQPRGLFIIMSIVGTFMTTTFSLTSYIRKTLDIKNKIKRRKQVYNDYLLKIRKKLDLLKNRQIDALEYNNPNPKEIEYMIENYSNRIYEVSMNDDDFLNISLGKSDVKASYNLSFDSNELDLEKDILRDEADSIYNKYKTLKKLPISINLRNSHLGIVGEVKNIHNILQNIIYNLTFRHSYNDIEIILFYSREYEDKFEWMKWYPHLKIKAINVAGLVSTSRARDQVLGSILQILKNRKSKQDDDKKESVFFPHYIFILEDPKLVLNHSIMEYFQQDNLGLGFSIIYTTYTKSNIPENIKTILILEDSQTGVLLLNESKISNIKIELDSLKGINLEMVSRQIASIEHVKGIKSQIPESVTFFELYGVKNPEELNIENRWIENSSHKTLAVPLGLRGEKDIVNLDLHEKSHGPHGLVAGTTGSGKSEIVQSYILSLAVNFHPYEVGFLLIDYKGGGMAGLFKNLPHLLGSITNLDGSQSMRAMASIKSELSRRQKVFSEYNVNHINQYNKIFKNGEAKNPIPHLFIISDEFAELKKEQPDFMSELVSAARIGRSLGIHLILATQKPSGVVDDQIWTNSKFKLALKVANEGDSNEIIKTPDAANITLPGRAYLQVGNNEIYELFQSAWSGASFTNDKDVNLVDDRIFLLNELGQGVILNKDLSLSDVDNSIKQTELDVVINYINRIYVSMNLKDVERPWLPNLKDQIVSPYIKLEKDYSLDNVIDIDLIFHLGVVDIPEKQSQQDYEINLTKDGNLVIFGSSGFGKSTSIITIAIGLAIKNNPNLLRFYIIDFGNASLIQLKGLPHTSDYISFDDIEKFNKFIKIISKELSLRKALFAKEGAVNFNMYNTIVQERLFGIVIFIDNYDVIKEINYEIEDFITKLSRDGPSMGVYIIITASRESSIKYAVLNNIKTKICLYMFDNSEINNIIGRSPYKISEIKGRSLIKLENASIMQIYVVDIFNDEIEYSNSIKDICLSIKNGYSGEPIKGIPMLPEVLSLDLFKEYIKTNLDNNHIPIGLDIEDVEPQYFNIKDGVNLIVGGSQKGKTNILKNIISFIDVNSLLFIIDSKDMELYSLKSIIKDSFYTESLDDANILLEKLNVLIEDRQKQFVLEKELNPELKPKEFYGNLKSVFIVIDDCDNFIDLIKNTKNNKAENIIIACLQMNISIIATTLSNKLKGFDQISKIFKESFNGIILGNPNDQSIFSISHQRSDKFPLDQGIIFSKGNLIKIKIPKSNI